MCVSIKVKLQSLFIIKLISYEEEGFQKNYGCTVLFFFVHSPLSIATKKKHQQLLLQFACCYFKLGLYVRDSEHC